ncbi:hypothetical protein FBQ83_11030 [Chloroflexi bacterium CFX5]|nr:hypothetical protein [Chloroflexota bacterium]MDL1919839.1 hypothetical protein [Chloroflexi bacterium CFX5]
MNKLLLPLLIAACAPAQSTPDETLTLAWTTQTDGAINQTPLIVGDSVILSPSTAPLLSFVKICPFGGHPVE